MSLPDVRETSRNIAHDLISKGDVIGWFDQLYKSAEGDHLKIPWADRRPNKNLVSWLQRESSPGRGKSCVVVGCGLGEDAELLARHGFKVTAFDVSPTAIDWCNLCTQLLANH